MDFSGEMEEDSTGMCTFEWFCSGFVFFFLLIKKIEDTTNENTATIMEEDWSNSCRDMSTQEEKCIHDRQWEKEQLKDISLRMNKVLNMLKVKIEVLNNETMQIDWLDEMQKEHQKDLEDITNSFLLTERKKAREMVDTKAEIRALRKKCKELEEELKELKTKHENEKKGHLDLSNRQDEIIQEKDRTLVEVQAAKAELEMQLNTLQQKYDKLFKDNTQLSVQMHQKESALQRQFAAKFDEMMEERREKYRTWKEESDEALAKKIESAQRTYEQQIEDFKHTIETQAQELEEFQNSCLESSRLVDKLKTELENELQKKKKQSGNNKQKRARDKVEKEMQMRQKEANSEFKRLNANQDYWPMCEKINLDLQMEIEILKQKLNIIEEQHKIESPLCPRKRRCTNSSLMETKILRSVQQENFPFRIVLIRQQDGWIGFELQNQWNRPIILKGWTLSDTCQSSTFPLPEKIFVPKETIRICLNSNKKQGNDLIWRGFHIKTDEKNELWVEDKLNSRHKIATFAIPISSGQFVLKD
ncbi:GTPase [Reticulomyxa filosa]|uniref:GTPase n=1 Tax=Reticulomyxa filosa TaxID=46433 RepID=X6P0V4_RETFI|nr:GTPase [Reticulomyxa filosa]|eukprot:ETO31167.1 GTPase [Reticulomyxa filosa]